MAGLFDKAKEFLNSEQGERISDSVLDKAAEFASKRTGGKHDEQIAQARKAADSALGRRGGQDDREGHGDRR